MNPELASYWFHIVRYCSGNPYVRKVYIRKLQLYLTKEHLKNHKRSIFSDKVYHQICLKGYVDHYVQVSFTE